MAILPILSVPNPLLRQRAQPIEAVTDDIRQLMDDMLETILDDNKGVGLAANQVGILKRVIVCHFSSGAGEEPLRMANPEILWSSDDTFSLTEGCLSLPEQWGEVVRPKTVKVRYLDYHNTLQEKELACEMSTVVQHEIDHLNGVLFIDHLPSVKKRLILERALKNRQPSRRAPILNRERPSF